MPPSTTMDNFPQHTTTNEAMSKTASPTTAASVLPAVGVPTPGLLPSMGTLGTSAPAVPSTSRVSDCPIPATPPHVLPFSAATTPPPFGAPLAPTTLAQSAALFAAMSSARGASSPLPLVTPNACGSTSPVSPLPTLGANMAMPLVPPMWMMKQLQGAGAALPATSAMGTLPATSVGNSASPPMPALLAGVSSPLSPMFPQRGMMQQMQGSQSPLLPPQGGDAMAHYMDTLAKYLSWSKEQMRLGMLGHTSALAMAAARGVGAAGAAALAERNAAAVAAAQQAAAEAEAEAEEEEEEEQLYCSSCNSASWYYHKQGVRLCKACYNKRLREEHKRRTDLTCHTCGANQTSGLWYGIRKGKPKCERCYHRQWKRQGKSKKM